MSSEQDAVERLQAVLDGIDDVAAPAIIRWAQGQDDELVTIQAGQIAEWHKYIEATFDFLEAQRSRLARSQQENERLRHGITAIIEGDKGDEPLETANQVVSLLEGLLAALEEQEAQDE